jgi:hypothetical protein
MTRDEINVAVWAVVGSWTITIETVPKRQLILRDALVAQLLSGAICPAEVGGMIGHARDARWTSNKDGSLAYLLK